MTMLTQHAPTSPVGWTPHTYQKRAVKWLLEHACAAMFLDPGLGKTSVTLAAIKMLKSRGVLNKVLVIAPLRVCSAVWPKERDKWRDFHDLRVEVLHGPKKNEALQRDADIFVINPEGLPWLLAAQKSQPVSFGAPATVLSPRAFRAKYRFDTLVVDELSRFKHTNTQRFKLMKPLLDTFSRRWGLTGSPAANGMMDLFGQVFMLDRGRSLGPYITHFRNQYFVPADAFGWDWRLRPGAEKEIYERIAPLALRMSAEEYLDLPPLMVDNLEVELPPQARTIYNQFENLLLAKINEHTVTVSTASAASMVCRQVANGAVYSNEDTRSLEKRFKAGREYFTIHDEKIEALADLVDELQGQPLLVAYEFVHDLERLQKKFPAAPYIGGGAKDVDVTIAAWNAGEVPLLLGHPASMGHGLNLQGASNHICWFSLTWNYELYDQTIRRVWRQGQNSRVFVYRVIARDTVDEVVLTALQSKKRGQDAFFSALQELARRRR